MMHPHAAPILEKITDRQTRERVALFLDTYDAMDRENTHLRLKLQAGGCPYGHASSAGCALGYPGCACMDDLMAMTAWSPEDEDKATVRLGNRVKALERTLDAIRQTAAGVALSLATAGEETLAAILREAVAQANPKVNA